MSTLDNQRERVGDMDYAKVPDEFRGISRAFGKMPYGAICHFRSCVTLADIEYNLDALVKVLTDHAARHDAMESEFNQFNRDVVGLRRLFGISETA